ncbi:MAG TPA: c-type cytochrome [Candidatus Baltobacteraceae bacterium]|nr:c-type cytochrome [Candidatus Baltobacteraceae bacterium]
MKRLLAVFALTLAACSSGSNAGTGTAKEAALPTYDVKELPPGPVGDSIRYGHDIIVRTQVLMKDYVRSDMSCAACHLDAGTKSKGGSLVGAYNRFPQWNKRSGRVITLQDRLAECFLYSMNGRPPAYSSKEMIALVSYVSWLSRGMPNLAKERPGDRFIIPLPSEQPNVAHGAQIYAQKCVACHQANGAGVSGTFPPLWGDTSFNNGAGMAHLDRMTGFVRYNMPKNAPGSLSVKDAYDVSAFVLSRKRPRFHGERLVAPEPTPARYF